MLQTNPQNTIVTVILQPLHSTFQTKTLELRDGIRFRIGRQTSSKTAPGPLNGYFDSKVLSRTHAEISNDQGKVYIKDVKSSNGTFLNGQRLSNENEESAPVELKMSDQLEFGIDISQDDGSILYHKVSCQVHVIPTPLSQVDSSVLKELNVGVANGNRTNKLQHKSSSSSISSISSTSTTTTSVVADGVSSPPAVSSKWTVRNWDLLLNKLQQEIQRSKEVENQLLSVKNAIGDANATFKDDRLAKADSRIAELQQKLEETQGQLGSYMEKSRHQGQAIASASQELRRLENIIRDLEKTNTHSSGGSSRNTDNGDQSHVAAASEMERWKAVVEEQRVRLEKDLMEEKERSLEYEHRCLLLEKRIKQLEEEQYHYHNHAEKEQPTVQVVLQMRSVQLLLAIVVGLISTLFYVFSTA